MSNKEIYEWAKLDDEEIKLVESYIDLGNDGCFYDTTSYHKLFVYFTEESGEMPYGTAKARTGDPEVWILDRLECGR